MCIYCEMTSVIIESIFGHRIPPHKIKKLIETSPLPRDNNTNETVEHAYAELITATYHLNKINTKNITKEINKIKKEKSIT